MKIYPMTDTKTGKLLMGLFLFAMLLLSRNTLVTTAILDFTRGQILMLGLMAAAGVLFLLKNRREWKEILLDRRMGFGALCALVLLFPMIIKGDWQLMYFSVLAAVLFAVFVSYILTLEQAAQYYVVMLTVLGVYSVLATYLLRILPDRGILSVPVFHNANGVMFHNFGFAFVSDEFVKNRNFGIFREPGVYQYFIILALLLNNYLIQWDKPWKWWFVNLSLAVTMLTTFATGGVAELGLLVLVVFFDKKLYKDKRVLLLAVAVVAVMIAALAVIIIRKNSLYWELYGMVIAKFTPQEESASERMDAIVTDLQFFLNHPLVGTKFSQVLHSVANNTTSTMVTLAVYGIGGGVLHVATWLALVWDRERKLWVNAMLALIMFLSFNTQNLVADVFFWLFPVMAVAQRWLNKKECVNGT